MDTTKLEKKIEDLENKIDDMDINMNGKRNAVVGTLTQAKGVAREALGKATNNPQMQLSGKKDQVVGTLQKKVGNSWAFQNKNLLVGVTTALAVLGAVAYYLGRSINSMSQTSYETTYTP